MKKTILTALLLTLVVFISCNRSADKERTKVLAMEKQYTSDPKFYSSKVKAEELLKAYTDFAEKYAGDTATPHFLFNAGNLAMNTNKPDMAIDLFKRVREKGNDNRYAASSLFLIGFVYENYKMNLVKAKDAYTEFLSLYPANSLAPSAKASLQNLGKTPEQLIKEFESKNAEDSLLKKK